MSGSATTGASGVDFSSLLSSVSSTEVVGAIMSVAAVIAVVNLAQGGAKRILSMIRSV
ncbi:MULTISPECIES: hypothetical protein [Asaia]|uniref:Uncharacterized protein n=1 Tax=Asaia spathodeae TaxID=657016 RepID=A0ABX2PAP9_9PROT|nr:hypothetical protein [Asaia spathodeae]